MRGRRAFPASTVPRKPQQQKMRICSIAKGPLFERAFLLAYEMASGNLKHCARVGRDQGGSIKGANVFSFNPRARAGRDVSSPRPGTTSTKFQSTRPRGARRPWHLCESTISLCFNPRARAGRDPPNRPNRMSRKRFQSTRPRGARQDFSPAVRNSTAFQSTRPRGARRETWLNAGKFWTFQSTLPRGARHPAPAEACGRKKFQSTRPRGARLFFVKWIKSVDGFQSTRPRGARHLRRYSSPNLPTFQSTRPRGARLSVRNRLYFRQDITNIPTTLTLLPEKAAPHPEKEVFFCFITLR